MDLSEARVAVVIKTIPHTSMINTTCGILLNFDHLHICHIRTVLIPCSMYVHVCIHVCFKIFFVFLFLPAGKVRAVVGRLVMQPIFVQSVTVKLYTWYGFSPFTT